MIIPVWQPNSSVSCKSQRHHPGPLKYFNKKYKSSMGSSLGYRLRWDSKNLRRWCVPIVIRSKLRKLPLKYAVLPHEVITLCNPNSMAVKVRSQHLTLAPRARSRTKKCLPQRNNLSIVVESIKQAPSQAWCWFQIHSRTIWKSLLDRSHQTTASLKTWTQPLLTSFKVVWLQAVKSCCKARTTQTYPLFRTTQVPVSTQTT